MLSGFVGLLVCSIAMLQCDASAFASIAQQQQLNEHDMWQYMYNCDNPRSVQQHSQPLGPLIAVHVPCSRTWCLSVLCQDEPQWHVVRPRPVHEDEGIVAAGGQGA